MTTKKRIMVVDDDPGVLEVMQIMLEESEYQVLALKSGIAIKEKVNEYRPQLILMDLLMPGVDGKEATILLKNCVTTKKIPIVIVAASNEIESITRQIGANDFLPKPFTMEKLLAMVAKYA